MKTGTGTEWLVAPSEYETTAMREIGAEGCGSGTDVLSQMSRGVVETLNEGILL